MQGRSLLGVGLALMLIAIVGASLSGPGLGWRGQNSMREHMSWMWGGSRTQNQPAISGAEEVVVIARDFSFAPTAVRVDAESPVNITLVNEGDVVHNLTIPELDLQVVADPGGRASAGLSPERAGEYRLECTEPGHAEAGMVGRLLIDNG